MDIDLNDETPTRAKRTRLPKFTPRPEQLSPLDRHGIILGARLLLAASGTAHGRVHFATLDEPISRILGWPHAKVSGLTGVKDGCIRTALRARLDQLCRSDVPALEPFEANLSVLAKRLGLTDADRAVLRVAALVELHRVPYQVADDIYVGSPRQLAELFADVTGQPPSALEQSLREDSVLFRTGLLSRDALRHRHAGLEDRLDLLDGLAMQLVEKDLARGGVVTPHIAPMAPARLQLAQYPHLAREVALIHRILQAALADRRPGVNILFYGPPGTGKTELARAILSAVGARGLEIKTNDEREEGMGRDSRMRAFALTQRLLADSTGQAVLFDEVEDVLASEGDWGLFMFGTSQGLSPKKGWKVSLMETNAAPTIWTCNGIWRIDPALQRRFTYCLEVPVPPRSVRLAMLSAVARKGPAAEALLGKIADSDQLTPADVDRVNRVLALCPASSEEEWREQVLLTLGARPDGVDTSSLLKVSAASCEIRYEPKWINAQPGVADVAARLQAAGEGRLCFAGPPGTGKTAFAKHLARTLDRPLMSKKASDLLSPYLGETEGNLAAAFKEARQDNAVLLIDEADSFLQDRRAATRSWEVTQVNEVLKQLEEHAGYVILSTNLYDHLDPAVLRRLDLKVTFRYLEDEHLPEVFRAAAAGMTMAAEPVEAFCAGADWRALKDLAMGDVAVAMRQVRLLSGAPSPAALFAALLDQLEHRNRVQGRPIGF